MLCFVILYGIILHYIILAIGPKWVTKQITVKHWLVIGRRLAKNYCSVMVVEQHWTTNIQFSLISCTLTCLYPEIFLEHRLHLSQAPKSSATDRLHQPYRQHDWIRRCLRRWCSHERWQTWSNPLEQLGVRQFEVDST